MTIRKAVVAVVATLALAPAPGARAEAVDPIVGVGASVGGSGTTRVVATGSYAAVPGTNGSHVVFQCDAAAIGVVTATTLTCTLFYSGGSAESRAIVVPGNAAAAGGSAVVPPGPLRVCWTASAGFATGGSVSTRGCTLDI